MSKKEIFSISRFWEFCNSLVIESKEKGLITLGTQLLGSQTYFIEEIDRGLKDDIHSFVCLKGRQLGISTICLALDLYWHFMHDGMQGTLITDTEDNREMFRSTLTGYIDGLPVEWRQPVSKNNRVMIEFGRIRSRMVYQVAGERANRGFGAGKAIVFLHGTETGKWGDGVDIASLEASFAESNPLRLFIYESTAYGMNQFESMYENAKEAVSQRAIFVGWWRNQFYRAKKDGEIYRTYYDGAFTPEERQWSDDVKRLYGHEIDDEQVAWFRWKLQEACGGELTDALEKYPWTDEQAFVMSGSNFFNVEAITERFKAARKLPYLSYRFDTGLLFQETELLEANDRTVTLKVWDTVKPNAYYAMGADPAWGSSEWADRFSISVYRCWMDGMEQVAEFNTPDCSTTHFAWILAYLAGYYGDPRLRCSAMLNLELNGPGMAVWTELRSMKRLAAMAPRDDENAGILNFLNNMDNFTYRRPDSLAAGLAWHTKSTSQEKERMLNLMKSYWQLGMLVIKSTECMNEMKNVIRVEGSLQIEAPGRKKDDRVISTALAALAWSDLLRIRLAQAGISRKKQEADESLPKEYQQAGISVANYLKTLSTPVTKPKRPNALRR